MELGLYITGIIVGYPGFAVLLWWIIKNVKHWSSEVSENLIVGKFAKRTFHPFLMWFYIFCDFTFIVLALFCTVMIGVGSY